MQEEEGQISARPGQSGASLHWARDRCESAGRVQAGLGDTEHQGSIASERKRGEGDTDPEP